MASSVTQQNLVPNEPGLKDLLDLLKKDIFLNLNCHHIGTIQTFDPARQVAMATINYKKTYFKPNPVTGLYDPVLVDYPVLIDCPVVCLGGGTGALTFPIAPGDECLVVFNDRDIDNWFSGSSNSAVATPRLHSFSDAVIIVGIRSQARALTNYNPLDVELRNGVTKLALTPTGQVAFQNTFGDLITAIFNILTTATAAGFPLIISPTDLAVLASFKPLP